MSTAEGTNPFRWWIFDHWCESIDLSLLPSREKSIWEARYDNDCENGKRTTRKPPEPYATILTRLQSSKLATAWSERLGYYVTTDDTNHGGGLHVTEPGGWLQTHLDYDLHPHRSGWRRALNLIAFVNSTWNNEWGGELLLCDAMGKIVHQVKPAPGRLFAFEVSDLSYHGVAPVRGHVCRVSIACYLLARCKGGESRQRALFMPNRG